MKDEIPNKIDYTRLDYTITLILEDKKRWNGDTLNIPSQQPQQPGLDDISSLLSPWQWKSLRKLWADRLYAGSQVNILLVANTIWFSVENTLSLGRKHAWVLT